MLALQQMSLLLAASMQPLRMHVQGLLEFLAYEPFYHNNVWRALLLQPLLGGHTDAKTPLRSLVQGVMLRRTRAHVGTAPALATTVSPS